MTHTNEFGESQQIFSALTRALKRHPRLIVLTLLGVLIPVFCYNIFSEPVYEASASLVFEEVASPVPDAVPSKTSPEQFLSNRLEEITSEAFATDVAMALPQAVKARIPLPNSLSENDRLKYISGVIHQSIAAYPLRSSNIFKIRVQMSDPRLCAAVANMSAKILQEREYRIRLRGIVELRSFIDQQLRVVGDKLAASESNLRVFKEANNITSLDSESNEVLRRMTEAEVLYNSNRADRDAAQNKLAALNGTLAAVRRDLVPSLTDIASPSAQKLKEKLVELQAQYAQLLVQAYPTDHPQMVSLRQEIEQTRKALADEATKVALDANVGDPIAQIEKYVEQSVSLQIDIASLSAREDALQRTVNGYRGYLHRLPGKEFELARLVRERDVNQKLYTELLEKGEEVRIAEAKQIPNSRVIDDADVPSSPIAPRKSLNLLLGSVFALILGTGISLVLESGARELDDTLEFEHETGWSVLALVPEMKHDGGWLPLPRASNSEHYVSNALASHLRPQSAPGESYLMLRTRLELLGMGTTYRTLLVTSGAPGEGKSTTLANLAAAFTAAGRSTIVVDAELRRPVMHDIFGVPKAPGLSDLLLTRNGHGHDHAPPPADAVATAESGARWIGHGPDGSGATEIVPGLRVLTSGSRVRNAHWEISKKGMSSVLEELKSRYDIILIDSASPALVHDTMMLAGIVDAVIVIVDAGAYDARRVMEIRRLLEPAGANVVGAVVTKVDRRSRYGSYYGEYYSHDS